MYRFYVEGTDLNQSGRSVELQGEDVNHIRNVLRLRRGDSITVSDGNGRDYHCMISDITSEKVVADILDVCDNFAELKTEITLFQGYPKSDKLELIIQKTVELGVTRIVPVLTQRTVIKPVEKKIKQKTERYLAIAKAAAKQSGRGIVPVVTEPVSFEKALMMASALEMNLIPYEAAEGITYSKKMIQAVKGKRSLGIFIGPEGGFTLAEVEQAKAIGACAITLGHRILRTETAGMAVLSIIMFELEED